MEDREGLFGTCRGCDIVYCLRRKVVYHIMWLKEDDERCGNMGYDYFFQVFWGEDSVQLGSICSAICSGVDDLVTMNRKMEGLMGAEGVDVNRKWNIVA
jgi:hypothetical protein